MASAGDATCANDPNFAIICSFLQKFSPMLNIQQPDILLLQQWLENSDEVAQGLRELHIKLLRKMRKTVHETAWETALVKFCYLYSSQDAWEVERFGYKKSSLKVKLRILTAILEFQFQLNGKFRNKFSNLSAEELRSEPIGRDQLGHSYWLTKDPACNFRIYQEHLDEEIWQVVASNRSEMETLISRLKGNEVVLPSLIGIIDEDSSSNSCPNAVIKPPPPEEQDDSQSSNYSTKAKVPNIKIKLESYTGEHHENGNLKNGRSKPKEKKENDDDAEEEEDDDEELEEEEEEGEEEENDVVEAKKAYTAPKELENGNKNVENGKAETEETSSNDKNNTRKVKPIIIIQSKVTSLEEKSGGKKRSLEDDDREQETERIVKKSRPTLLDNRREKKSKYENYSEEEEDDDDEDEDDGGEEEEEEGEEEEEEDEEDVPNGEETAEEDEVGEEIEEDVLIVKGEGSGKDCDGSFLDEIQIGCEENDDNPVGEEIEEEIFYVYGEGSGKQSLVGNTNEETGKSSFFFGQPGCLKLSPIKKSVDTTTLKQDDDQKSNDKDDGQKNGEAESNDDRNIPKEESLKSEPNEEKVEIVETQDVKNDKIEVKYEKSEGDKEITATKNLEIINKSESALKTSNEQVDRVNMSEQITKEQVDIVNIPKQTNDDLMKSESASKTSKEQVDSVNTSKQTTKEQVDSVAISKQTLDDLMKYESASKTSKEPVDSVCMSKQTTKEQVDSVNISKQTNDKPPTLGRICRKKIVPKRPVFTKNMPPEKTSSIPEIDESIQKDLDTKKCEEVLQIAEDSQPNLETTKSKIDSSKEQIKSDQKSEIPEILSQSQVESLKQTHTKDKNLSTEKAYVNSLDKTKADVIVEAITEGKEKVIDKPAGNVSKVSSNELSDISVNISVDKAEEPKEKVVSSEKSESQSKNVEPCDSDIVEIEPTEAPPLTKKFVTPIIVKEIPTKLSQPQVHRPKKATEIIEVSTKSDAGSYRSKKLDEKPTQSHTANTRKRRLSEDKVRHIHTSDSDTDPNSDSAAPPTEEDEDVGGKRLKMRIKVVNTEIRKTVEKKRKSGEKNESTSEDENLVLKSSKDDAKSVEKNSAVPIEPPAEVIAKKSAALVIPETTALVIPAPTLLPVQTRATRSNPAGNPVTVLHPKPRSRKKVNVPTPAVEEVKSLEIPSLKPELPIDEVNTKNDDLPVLEKMPKLEPEANGPKNTSPTKSSTESPKKQRARKREIDTSNIIDTESETPVRQSRRIAQLKIREEAERRKLEEVALKKMKAELKKKKKEENKTTHIEYIAPSEPSDEDTEVDSEAEMSNKKIASKKKIRGLKNERWSSGPEDEPEEDEEYDLPNERYETDPGSPLFRSDHEFSPESEIEDESQVVPLKRARTVRKEGADEGIEENLNEGCQKCGKKDHPEWILLCDKCDKGYHCSCLSPVLFIIPEGDWFCPPCQQDQLIGSLQNQMQELDDLVEQKRINEEEDVRLKNLALAQKLKDEEEEAKEKEVVREKKSRTERVKKRRKPRVRKAFVVDDDEDHSSDNSDNVRSSEASSDNSSSSGSKSSSSSTSNSDDDEPIYKLRKRRQVNVSYRFNEYDDLINSAIKKEMDEVAGAGNLGRGKDISTIIEADKEEKMRQKHLDTIREGDEEVLTAKTESEVKKEVVTAVDEKPGVESKAGNDSGSDFEPTKRKSKVLSKSLKKKNRKLNNLDISSDDDGSDEDFKTSSYETEEDESISAQTESDSSLEVYRRRGKKGKKNKRPSRRAVRERRRLDADFIVEDSDASDDWPKKKKIKRKYNWELRDSGSEEELSEQIDSEDLCDDSTDSEDSDGAWRPSRRKKTKINAVKQKPALPLHGKQPRKIRKKEIEPAETTIQPQPISKGKHETDESDDDVPRTRGKRFTYLEDFEDDSSDDGIKPGVKRPDTPPEEREKFIKKQEEIKRMLAEKNTEAAKAAATPTLTPLSKSGPTDSLSTVPLSVIKGAKVLDMDYLQRKGELNSDDADTDFDEDLPDDFDPEDMDEEEIAKMMEEEDFAQQQLKLAGEAIRQKKLKEMEQLQRAQQPSTPVYRQHSSLQIQEPTRKRLPMPTIQPLFSNTPRFLPPHHRMTYELPIRQSVPPPSIPLSVQSLQIRSVGSIAGGSSSNALSPPIINQGSANEPPKPRGRRKKITPLRDTLQKQQAAAAATAAAASVNQTAKDTSSVADKPAAGSKLSVAQPPQLYTPPTSTPPSVITRMPQPPRPRFSEQSSRFYPPPNQLVHRPSLIRHGGPMPPHHTLRPSFASGPPPLRPSNPRLPISIGNGINRQPCPRQMAPFTGPEQYTSRSAHPTPHAYRPPLYGSPGYPPAPPQQPSPSSIHPAASDFSASSYGPTPPYGPYYPPPQTIGPTHSTPPPPTASAVPPSSVIAPSLPDPSPPPPLAVAVAEASIPTLPARPKATPLETFDSKSTPPLLEAETTNSPYSSAAPPDNDEGESERPQSNSTSEFSGLVSYFSSQHDDLNT